MKEKLEFILKLNIPSQMKMEVIIDQVHKEYLKQKAKSDDVRKM